MTLSLTVASDTGIEVPRIRLTVASTPSGAKPVPTNSYVRFYRVHPDASVWPVITEANTRISAGSAVVDDYHCPFNLAVAYYVEAAGYQSDWVRDGYNGSDVAWLINSFQPERSVALAYVSDIANEQLPWMGSVIDIPRNPYPVTRSFGARSAGRSSITVAVEAGREELIRTAISKAEPMLLNIPPAAGWPVSYQWIQPLDVELGNEGATTIPGGKAGYPYRVAVIPYVKIRQPDFDLAPPWTDGDLVAAYPTDSAVTAAFATDRGRTLNIPGA